MNISATFECRLALRGICHAPELCSTREDPNDFRRYPLPLLSGLPVAKVLDSAVLADLIIMSPPVSQRCGAFDV